MEPAKFNEWSIKHFGLLLFAMLIFFGLLVFVDSLSLDTQDANKTLLGPHKDLLVGARVVHKGDRLRGYLSRRIKVS
jgi:hypothetical protein